MIICPIQIDQEREGEQIDRALLKNVLDIYVEIGMGQMDQYESDFEEAMLKDTAEYYSRKASNWILEDSCPDYMLKASILFSKVDILSYYILFLNILFATSGRRVSETRERQGLSLPSFQ